MMRCKWMIGTFAGVWMAMLAGGAGAEDRVDRTPASNQVPHAPADGDVTAVNPPAFVWVPADGVDAYVVEYSTDPGFEPAETTVVEDVDISVYTPTETLEPGEWYWRYGIADGDGERVYSQTRAFTIPEDAQAFPRITIDDAMARIPDERPRPATHRGPAVRAGARVRPTPRRALRSQDAPAPSLPEAVWINPPKAGGEKERDKT